MFAPSILAIHFPTEVAGYHFGRQSANLRKMRESPETVHGIKQRVRHMRLVSGDKAAAH
jgi:hypothetical protein